MFCSQCGKKNDNTAKFCGGCGAAIATSQPAQTNQARQKQSDIQRQQPARPKNLSEKTTTPRSKRKIIIIAVVAFVVLLAGASAIWLMPKSTPEYDEQIRLGYERIEDGQYEEAIDAFDIAIEIDEKRPQAYIGLADTHYAEAVTWDYVVESVDESLRRGYEMSESDEIADAYIRIAEQIVADGGNGGDDAANIAASAALGLLNRGYRTTGSARIRTIIEEEYGSAPEADGVNDSETRVAVGYTEVVPPKYDGVGSFSEGMAVVLLGGYGYYADGEYITGKWGFIDKTGKEVVPLKYDHAWDFSEGLAMVNVGGLRWSGENGKMGFIDKTGKEVIPIKYEDGVSGDDSTHRGSLTTFSEGMKAFFTGDWETGWGFIDKTGNEVVPPKYSLVWEFSDGVARVIDSNGKMGVIDKTGREIVPPKYDYIGDFSDGLAMVNVGGDMYIDTAGKWGFIDKTGKEVVPLIYDEVYHFHDGMAAVNIGADEYGQGGKWGFIDKTGKEVVPLKYDQVDYFHDGMAAVSVGGGKHDIFDYYVGKWGFIDKTGNEVIPLKYDLVAWRGFSEGLAAVNIGADEFMSGGKWGVIDKTGREVVPPEYDYIGDFSDDLAVVTLDEKKAFIDKTGKEIMPLKYDSVWSFSEGLARVTMNGKYGFIDRTGKEIVPLIYDEARDFQEGMAAINIGYDEYVGGGKWGFIAIEWE